MRITTSQDPKVQEFLEYMGVGKSQWCQIQIEPDCIVGVEYGMGTTPPWHLERQQKELLETIESNTRIIEDTNRKIEEAIRSTEPVKVLEELQELTPPR